MEQVTPRIENITPNTGRMLCDDERICNVVNSDLCAVKVADCCTASVSSGKAWTYSSDFTISAGATIYLLGKAGDVEVHFDKYYISADGAPITVQFFEAPTVTAEGTLAASYARNRIIGETASLELHTTPTITADGTRLFIRKILGTHNTTGSEEMASLWILKKNTYYAFKITNGSNQAARLVSGFNWMEL
jgi:hypothetical protein